MTGTWPAAGTGFLTAFTLILAIGAQNAINGTARSGFPLAEKTGSVIRQAG